MNPYPSMTSTGWYTDPELAINAILNDYCYCERGATKLYPEMIRSLPYQLMRYTDEMALASVVQDDLTALYKNHFDGVDCTVTYDPDNQHQLGSESPRYYLEVTLIITDEGSRYSLAKVLNIDNSKVIMIGETTV